MNIIDFFRHNKREQRGTILLLIISLSILFIRNEIISREKSLSAEKVESISKDMQLFLSKLDTVRQIETSKYKKLFQFNPNKADSNKFIALGLNAKQIKIIMNYRRKGGTYRKSSDFAKMYCISDEEFERLEPYIFISEEKKSRKKEIAVQYKFKEFDPNTADLELFISMGLEKRLAENIINYRRKGGFFRKKEDLLKLYNLDKELYEKLLPYVKIAKQEKTKVNENQSIKIEINTASKEDFEKISVNSYLAARIIKFRTILGGFVSINQIKEVYGIKESIFRRIAPKLEVDKNKVKKIDINFAEISELKKHPYFRKYANNIVRNRTKSGSYKSLKDIEKIIPKEDFEKMRYYLKF